MYPFTEWLIQLFSSSDKLAEGNEKIPFFAETERNINIYDAMKMKNNRRCWAFSIDDDWDCSKSMACLRNEIILRLSLFLWFKRVRRKSYAFSWCYWNICSQYCCKELELLQQNNNFSFIYEKKITERRTKKIAFYCS